MSRTVSISMEEWEVRTPAEVPALAGRGLGGDVALERLAERLTAGRQLEVLELARGLRLRTFQYVGRLQLGDLEVSIRPKLIGAPLLRLLRYAYGLRQLELFEEASSGTVPETFLDLLIHQLVRAAMEILARGLHRRYRQETDWLASPRGRIDLQRLAAQPTALTALPCAFHSRLEDCLVNQVLRAGLELAGGLATDTVLRGRARRLAAVLAESTSGIRLEPQTFSRLDAQIDRLTTAYRPAITLVRLLHEGQGSSLEGEGQRVTLPGFLFDMNRFFQALLSRFLHGNLGGLEVQDEWRLSELIRYVPGLNPRGAAVPTPRPDFAVLSQGRIIALLDAKYRDLWANPLPRDMLYQLALYATSQGEGGRATILFPTLDPGAREAALQIRAPGSNLERARIVVRPVDLHRLDRLLSSNGTAAERERNLYARWLVGGAAGDKSGRAELGVTTA